MGRVEGDSKRQVRHRQDSWKTFANRIEAARYGEEVISAHKSKKLARESQMTDFDGVNWDLTNLRVVVNVNNQLQPKREKSVHRDI